MDKFRIKPATSLKVCTDQVASIMSSPRYRNATWTLENMRKRLVDIGLDYTLKEVELINTELIKRGIVEKE